MKNEPVQLVKAKERERVTMKLSMLMCSGNRTGGGSITLPASVIARGMGGCMSQTVCVNPPLLLLETNMHWMWEKSRVALVMEGHISQARVS